MKRNGFTLMELLAVIVILAVIAVITTPLIIGVIERAKKGALQDSAYGLLESSNLYYTENMVEGTNEKLDFTFSNGIQTSENKLSYKGKIEKGSLKLFKDGNSAVCISEGKYIAIKNVNDKKVVIKTGRCEYNEETNEYETVELCQDLQDEIDRLKREHQTELERLKKEYDDKVKQLKEDHALQIKTLNETYQTQLEVLNAKIKELEETHQIALDQLKVEYEARLKTQKEAYELQITELNKQLNVFKTGGTATTDKILAGVTAFVKGNLITGTMPNIGSVNQTLNAGGIYTIPAGYHNGAGKITTKNLASQTPGTATADKILEGQTAWVNGNKITGTANSATGGQQVTVSEAISLPAWYNTGNGSWNNARYLDISSYGFKQAYLISENSGTFWGGARMISVSPTQIKYFAACMNASGCNFTQSFVIIGYK